jgi:hypothetical protein
MLGVTSVVEAGIICREPAPKLEAPHQRNSTIFGQTVTFFYGSEFFPIDVYSAYAPKNPNQSDSEYCIRYEATNKARNEIQKFYWPEPGVVVDSFQPKDFVSLVITRPAGKRPTKEESWIYAFLNEVRPVLLWQQKRAELDRKVSTERLAFLGGQQIALRAHRNPPVQLAAFDGIQNKFELKDSRDFPVIGSEFLSSTIGLEAQSAARWFEGKLEISVSVVGKPNEKLFAPVAYALSKAVDIPGFIAQVRELKARPLPMLDNTFKWTRTFEKPLGSLYVVEQPITLYGPNGRICFLAPVYIPIPIPDDLLRCDIS